MSMFNDIDWTRKENEENCISNSVEVKMYAKRFSQGHWTFLGRGVEKKFINQCDVQTDDGHAMKTSDTFHSFQNSRNAVRGCHSNCRQVRTNITTRMYASPKTGREVAS